MNWPDKNLIEHYNCFGKNENRIYNKKTLYKKQSIINIDLQKSKVAFFMIIPTDNLNGGCKTSMNYINFLINHDIYVDIYFGNCTNDMKLTKVCHLLDIQFMKY